MAENMRSVCPGGAPPSYQMTPNPPKCPNVQRQLWKAQVRGPLLSAFPETQVPSTLYSQKVHKYHSPPPYSALITIL